MAGDVSAGDGMTRRAPGSLEAQVLAVLRATDAALSPGEVRERLAAEGRRDELSYSTVVTTLSRLHAKGRLERERLGRAFRYTPAAAADVAAHRMQQALDTETDRDAVLTRFVSRLSGRDEELLRRLLQADTTDRDSSGHRGNG